MSDSKDDFEKRKQQRELPTCPPVKDKVGYAYEGKPIKISKDLRIFPLFLHYAAPFALTRWTNIYVPAKFGLFGDIIGGPLADIFGYGIKDVPVTIDNWARNTPFAHTKYWHNYKPSASGYKKEQPENIFAMKKKKLPYALSALKQALALL